MHGDRDHRIPQTSIETRTTPDTWRVIVEPSDGSSKVTRKVPEERWNEIEIGDHWEDRARRRTESVHDHPLRRQRGAIRAPVERKADAP